MRKRTIKKQIWINQTENNLLKAKAVNTFGYIRDEDLEYIKNTMPKFILDFQKRLYSRGGDSIGSNKN